ncbi:MAG: hypothetical protein DRP74_05055 [Candidatus Omnitrophota bacterium]|nr:MAG: hypothetical protein DRP74_05055 [Candidatus Omnitrophota bacterium]
MANPLPNERQIYEKIEKQNIIIPPLVWELINHHIRNDLYMINLIIGSVVLDGEPLSAENAKKVLSHTNSIGTFLDKLCKLTQTE